MNLCKCSDWKEGYSQLDAFSSLGYVHGLRYDGPKWIFCPWCGQELIGRIQRKRTSDWEMPENTVYVGRPTKWGNPFKSTNPNQDVVKYKEYILKQIQEKPEIYDLSELAGKNLACWCSLDQICHADILLDLAN